MEQNKFSLSVFSKKVNALLISLNRINNLSNNTF